MMSIDDQRVKVSSAWTVVERDAVVHLINKKRKAIDDEEKVLKELGFHSPILDLRRNLLMEVIVLMMHTSADVLERLRNGTLAAHISD